MVRLALAVLLCTVLTGTVAADDGECGQIVRVDAFQAKIGGLDISFPANMEIRVNDRVVFRGEDPGPWAFPYTGVLIAATPSHVLVETYDQDCVDLLGRRLFMLSRAGDLILTQPIWTSHWKDAFYYEGDDLAYWSEWFCEDANKLTSTATSYVYVSRDGRALQREERPFASLCTETAISEILSKKIQFRPIEPPDRGAE